MDFVIVEVRRWVEELGRRRLSGGEVEIVEEEEGDSKDEREGVMEVKEGEALVLRVRILEEEAGVAGDEEAGRGECVSRVEMDAEEDEEDSEGRDGEMVSL